MLEPTNEQLKELHKDIMSGDVMTITTEHYKQQAEQIKALEADKQRLRDRLILTENRLDQARKTTKRYQKRYERR